MLIFDGQEEGVPQTMVPFRANVGILKYNESM